MKISPTVIPRFESILTERDGRKVVCYELIIETPGKPSEDLSLRGTIVGEIGCPEMAHVQALLDAAIALHAELLRRYHLANPKALKSPY